MVTDAISGHKPLRQRIISLIIKWHPDREGRKFLKLPRSTAEAQYALIKAANPKREICGMDSKSCSLHKRIG